MVVLGFVFFCIIIYKYTSLSLVLVINIALVCFGVYLLFVLKTGWTLSFVKKLVILFFNLINGIKETDFWYDKYLKLFEFFFVNIKIRIWLLKSLFTIFKMRFQRLFKSHIRRFKRIFKRNIKILRDIYMFLKGFLNLFVAILVYYVCLVYLKFCFVLSILFKFFSYFVSYLDFTLIRKLVCFCLKISQRFFFIVGSMCLVFYEILRQFVVVVSVFLEQFIFKILEIFKELLRFIKSKIVMYKCLYFRDVPKYIVVLIIFVVAIVLDVLLIFYKGFSFGSFIFGLLKVLSGLIYMYILSFIHMRCIFRKLFVCFRTIGPEREEFKLMLEELSRPFWYIAWAPQYNCGVLKFYDFFFGLLYFHILDWFLLMGLFYSDPNPVNFLLGADEFGLWFFSVSLVIALSSFMLIFLNDFIIFIFDQYKFNKECMEEALKSELFLKSYSFVQVLKTIDANNKRLELVESSCNMLNYLYEQFTSMEPFLNWRIIYDYGPNFDEAWYSQIFKPNLIIMLNCSIGIVFSLVLLTIAEDFVGEFFWLKVSLFSFLLVPNFTRYCYFFVKLVCIILVFAFFLTIFEREYPMLIAEFKDKKK